MDELRYMKQLVREYLDLTQACYDQFKDLNTYAELNAMEERMSELEKELGELTGFDQDDVRQPKVLDDY